MSKKKEVAETKLKEQLNLLTNIIVTDKKLVFPIPKYNFDQCLIDENILEEEQAHYKILDYNIVATYLLKHFKQSFSFEINPDFKKNADFLDKISEYFLSENRVNNFLFLRDELWRIVIKETNQLPKANFHDFIISLDPQIEKTYSFARAYSKELPKLTIKKDFLYSSIKKLVSLLNSNVSYNIPLSNLLLAIKEKCKQNYSFGMAFLKLVLRKEETNNEILASIISGLYEEKRNHFYTSFLQKKVNNNTLLTPIFTGFANVNDLTNEDCQLFIQLGIRFKKETDLTFPILSMLTSILKSKNTLYYEECLLLIEELATHENDICYLINNLQYEKNLNFVIDSLIRKLIHSNNFSIKQHSSIIDDAIYQCQDFELFESIVILLTEVKPFINISTLFTRFLNTTFHDNSKMDDFKKRRDLFIIDLLTSNEAVKRHVGNDLFHSLSYSKRTSHYFAFNILDLEPIKQYKLWVSLCQGVKEPKYYIPCLLPLLDSSSSLVKVAFVSKLELLSEDYRGEIIRILKENTAHSNITEKISNYLSSFYRTNIQPKSSLKELDPFYTQNDNMKLFSKIFYRDSAKSIRQNANEKSLANLLGIKTIHLAKGGGWKTGSNQDISPLVKFEHGITLPISYFIDPDRYDIDKNIQLKEDWKESDFYFINQCIEDEQQ